MHEPRVVAKMGSGKAINSILKKENRYVRRISQQRRLQLQARSGVGNIKGNSRETN